MWIQNTNPERYPTRELKNEHTNGEVVKFSSNWTANVSETIGEQLVKRYDHFEATDDVDDGDVESTE